MPPVFGFAYPSLQVLPTGFYWANTVCPVHYETSGMSGLPLFLGLKFIAMNKQTYIIYLESLYKTVYIKF